MIFLQTVPFHLFQTQSRSALPRPFEVGWVAPGGEFGQMRWDRKCPVSWRGFHSMILSILTHKVIQCLWVLCMTFWPKYWLKVPSFICDHGETLERCSRAKAVAGEGKPGTAVETVKTVTTRLGFAGQSLIVAVCPWVIVIVISNRVSSPGSWFRWWVMSWFYGHHTLTSSSIPVLVACVVCLVDYYQPGWSVWLHVPVSTLHVSFLFCLFQFLAPAVLINALFLWVITYQYFSGSLLFAIL